MKVSDDLLVIAAEIQLALNNSDSSKVNIEIMKWEAELLVYHFKGLSRNKPIGYISQDGLNSLSENCDAITSSKQQYNKVIPLYKLD
ncbi:hypothetical protein ABZ131_18460 [Providencia rettgeri]